MFFRTNAVVFLAAIGAVGAIPTAFAHNSALEQHVNHGTDHAADTEVAIDANTAPSSFTQEPGDMEELTRIFSDEAGSNQILSCLAAEVGCVSEDPSASCDASASKKGGGDRGAAGGGKARCV